MRRSMLVLSIIASLTLGTVAMPAASAMVVAGIAISADGPAVYVPLPPGQVQSLDFTGTQGQRIGLDVVLKDVVQSNNINVKVRSARSGAEVASGYLSRYDSAGRVGVSATLPFSGAYVVLIEPDQTFNGAVEVTMRGPASPAVQVNGPAVGMDLQPGQYGLLRLAGKANQRVGIDLQRGDVTLNNNINVRIRSAKSGLEVTSGYLSKYDDGGRLGVSVTLPASGDYQVWVEPDQTFLGPVTVTLRATLVRRATKGTPVILDLQPGQSGMLTLVGRRNQRVGIDLQRGDVTLNNNINVRIRNARSGAEVTSGYLSKYDDTGRLGVTATLPKAGRYQVWIEPDQTFLGPVSVTVR